MTRQTPRVEFHFPVAQTAEDASYVPERTQDENMIGLYEGGPRGIRITKDQKIGNLALAQTFDWIRDTGTEDDLRSISRLASYVGFGTAFHLYAERYAHEVMYRKPDLAEAVDLETGRQKSAEEMNARISNGLWAAASMSIEIERMLVQQRPDEELNLQLGGIMAETALTAAAVAEGVPKERGSAIHIQDKAYMAGTKAYVEMLQLSGKIDARVTSAHLANPYSPLMIHLNKASLVTRPVLRELKANIAEVIASEPRL